MRQNKFYLGILTAMVMALLLAIPAMAAEDTDPAGEESDLEEEEPGEEDPGEEEPDKEEPDKEEPDKEEPDKEEPDKGEPDDTPGYNGFHQDPDTGDWYYYTDGQIDTSVTEVKKGTVDDVNGWWNVVAGKVTRGETVAKNANGWWYVYNGKVLFDDALTYAAQFVGANTTTGQTNSAKLAACYRVLWSTYPYVRTYGDSPNASVISQYAIDMFKNKKGNCFRYAASFACIAKVLGYDSRFAHGMISSASGGMTPHGWTEVYNDGQWLICDPDMQMNYPNINSYMQTESSYAYRHTCTARYTLTVTASGAVWK